MNRTRRIIGQILLAVGATLALGGLSSFLLDSVQLRFMSHIVSTENGRIVWIVAYGLLACVGFYLWRSSRTGGSLEAHRSGEGDQRTD